MGALVSPLVGPLVDPLVGRGSLSPALGPHPQYGWAFPEAIPEKFRKDPKNALRAFPGIPIESTAGIPSPIIKAFEASRAFPELSPPRYGWWRLFFQKWFWRWPLRAGHGIPSSTEGISELCVSPISVALQGQKQNDHKRFSWLQTRCRSVGHAPR